MVEGVVRVDGVMVPSTLTAPVNDPRFVEITDDAHDRPLSDRDSPRQIPDRDVGIVRNAEKDVRVVGQEVPRVIAHVNGPLWEGVSSEAREPAKAGSAIAQRPP